MNREDIFNKHGQFETDAEYFQALKNNKIGDLKGKGAAKCTEISALAQQILSLFGLQSYYCLGCTDLDFSQEPHCFNIVKAKNNYLLIDYSIPIAYYKWNNEARFPFIGVLSNKEFLNLTVNGSLKIFEDYYVRDGKIIQNDIKRTYVVGKYEIEKEEIIEAEKKK